MANDDDGFHDFWALYPRKVARKAAFKAWQKLRPDPALRETLLAALRAQMQSEQWQSPQYIPHASTWLNGERWTDQLPTRRLSPPVSHLVQAVQDFLGSSSPVTSSPKSLPGSPSPCGSKTSTR